MFRLAIPVFRCRNQTALNTWRGSYSGPSRSIREEDCGQRRRRGWLYAERDSRTAGDRAFSAAVPRLWNSLPAHVVDSQLLATFKGRLKTFLFKQLFDH